MDEEWRDDKRETAADETARAQSLVGATILSATVTGHDEPGPFGTDVCDCVNVLRLETTKGTFAVTGYYGSYTGHSCDEYIQLVTVGHRT